MRYGIFSDVHSNLEAFDAVMEAYQKENIDEYLCVGDVVGYGANPMECIRKLNAITKITVAGNHDWASVDLFSTDYFNPAAAEAIYWTKPHLDIPTRSFLESLNLVFKNSDLTLAHGTLESPQDFDYMTNNYIASKTFTLLKTSICFVGHSHVPGIFVKDQGGSVFCQEDESITLQKTNQYIVNVGSVGQPRDNNPDSVYCIYDTVQKKVRLKRIKYDIQAARKKIIDAGLPRFLGDRILLGR